MYPTGADGGYPEVPLNVFAALCRDPDSTNEQILDGLVDVVNRSPYSPQAWAALLGIEFNEFVKTCHRERDVSPDFRSVVVAFFSKFPTDRVAAWEEVVSG